MAKKDVNKTANLPTPPDVAQAQDIAKSIADQLAKVAPGAQVNINPEIKATIPQAIAHNLLEFLRRVKCEGMEAVAWVEAYQYVQQFVPQQGPPQGVPFTGLPPQPAKQA
jgi:hypothetical protein